MNDEIRKAGDYTIINSIHIGSKEIVLGENLSAPDGNFYLVSDYESNDIFERYTNSLVSDDFIEAARIFSDRLAENIAELEKEQKAVTFDNPILGKEHCTLLKSEDELKNKLIVISPEALRPEYRTSVNQLYIATGGHGSFANARGTSVFCDNLYSGEKTRFRRNDVLGIAKLDTLPQWAKDKINCINEIQNTPDVFEYGGKHFVPMGTIPKKYGFSAISKLCKDDNELDKAHFHIDGDYSHKAFYDACGNKPVDVFRCIETGKLYIPAQNQIFEYTGTYDDMQHKTAPDKSKTKSNKEAER